MNVNSNIKIHEETAPLPASSRQDVPKTRGYEAAVSAAIEALRNCYTREGGEWRPVPAQSAPEFAVEGDEFVAVLPFPDERTAVLAGIRHLSPTHRHRFRTPVHVAMAGGKPWVVSVDTLMGMLADELGASESVYDDDISAAGTRGPDPTFLLSRVRQHIATLGAFLDARADEIDDPAVLEQARDERLAAQVLELPWVDGQQHALAEVRERRVERAAVDRRVLAQQLLGELGRRRVAGAV